MKTSKPSPIEIIYSAVKGQGWELAKYETSLGIGLAKAKKKNTWKFDTSKRFARLRKQLKINYSKATMFKTFCHPRMMLRAVINSRGLIRRKNCSRKRTLPQKLVPWSKLYKAHSSPKFWRKIDVDYHTKRDTVHTQLQYFKRQCHFSYFIFGCCFYRFWLR